MVLILICFFLIQTYGYESFFTLNNLAKAGLFKEKVNAMSFSVFVLFYSNYAHTATRKHKGLRDLEESVQALCGGIQPHPTHLK